MSNLLHPDFQPTKKGTKIKIAILRGKLFKNDDRLTANVHVMADKLKLGKLNADIACLIRSMFTDKEIEAMGLDSIVFMHNSISGGFFITTTGVCRDHSWFGACHDSIDNKWSEGVGFALEASQVLPQD